MSPETKLTEELDLLTTRIAALRQEQQRKHADQSRKDLWGNQESRSDGRSECSVVDYIQVRCVVQVWLVILAFVVAAIKGCASLIWP